jgi:hypothetical protein
MHHVFLEFCVPFPNLMFPFVVRSLARRTTDFNNQINNQGCQIFLDTIYQNRILKQIATFTKLQCNKANGHKEYHMVIKVFSVQRASKMHQNGEFCLKINHLATLLITGI